MYVIYKYNMVNVHHYIAWKSLDTHRYEIYEMQYFDLSALQIKLAPLKQIEMAGQNSNLA